MAEAAVPTIVFTVTFLVSRDIRLALSLSVGAALVLLAVRLVQRTTVQFVINSLVGIGVGALFAWRSAQPAGRPTTRLWPTSCPGSSTTPATPSSCR